MKSILQKYLSKDLSVKQALDILQIKRSRFFILFNNFKDDSDDFTISYRRRSPKRISQVLEEIIIHELEKEKGLIDNRDIPIRNYNYSYIGDQIYKNHSFKVSVPTIIKRAKENNFYFPKKVRKTHDREVLTNYPGELIQHDSSFHKSPQLHLLVLEYIR